METGIPSLDRPQLVPSDHVYVVLQDFGPEGGGWGPAAWAIRGATDPRPVVYTGDNTAAIESIFKIARLLHDETGKPTKVCVYRVRDELATYE